LGYGLIWVRQVELVVGSGPTAFCIVLSALLLGLGVGSAVLGRGLRSQRRSPLFIFGLFQAAIGAYAVSFPSLLRLLETAYSFLYPQVGDFQPGIFALRFALLFVLFLPPTFFMGGTLPLLLDGLVERDSSIGPFAGILYALSLAGGALGILLATYFVIPHWSMVAGGRAGGIANLTIGLTALLAFPRRKPIHTWDDPAPMALFFPLASFATGLLAVAYQVALARYFSLFHAPSIYHRAMPLPAYLLGAAAGNLVLAPLLAARLNPLRILGWVQALVPLAVLYTLSWWQLAEYGYAIREIPTQGGTTMVEDTLEIDPGYHHYWRLFGETADATFFAPLFQVALVAFLPAALLGMGLPSLIAAAAVRGGRVRRTSGRLIFWNVVGSSAGILLVSFGLLPHLGLHRSLAAIALGSAALALAVRFKVRRTAWAPHTGFVELPKKPGRALQSQPGSSIVPLALLGFAPSVFFLITTEDLTPSTILHHGYGRSLEVAGEGTRPPGNPQPALNEILEGPLATSFVLEDEASLRIGSGNLCRGVIEKKRISPQAIAGHLPCLFYPGSGHPEDCLGICLGSGQTFGALLLHPVRRLDVVENSPEVLELSLRRFDSYQHGLSGDKRVKFHLDDGRHFVARAPAGSYDAVTLEPPPPTSEGVARLYSVEFYRQVARVLRPGGVLLQRLPLDGVTPLDARGIIKTQAAVFEHTFVVGVEGGDFALLSYPVRPAFSPEAIRERVLILERERLVKGARRSSRCLHDIATVEGVISSLVMSPQAIREMEGGLIDHDGFQHLSTTSGDRWLLRRYEGLPLRAFSFTALRLSGFAELAGYFDPPLSPQLIADLEKERAGSLSEFQVPDPATMERLERTLQEASDPAKRVDPALSLAALYDEMLAKEEAYRYLGLAIEDLTADGSQVKAEYLSVARRIVRNCIVAYEDIAERWVARLARDFPASPLVRAMREELLGYQRREEERLSGYWWR
jgi:predicted membrane-bound spermidine synthase